MALNVVKTKTVQEITSCEPWVIQRAFDEIEALCQKLGLMEKGVLLTAAADRLLVTDEKGFSARWA